ncbi:UNVERIFIED_CONTAM: hypothetical protein GTU68_044834, partial [Idotea baltica]|nr:hypothetical protein [Idotea baltica]
MLCLDHLPPPPPEGKITACENDGQLHAFNSLEAKQKIHEWLGNYNVEVYIGQENARSAYSKYEAKEAFSAHTETLWQRLTAAYYEEGLVPALHQLSSEEEEASPLLKKVSGFLLKIFESLERAKSFLPSPSKQTSMQILDTSLQVNSGCVLRIAWHPHTSTLAAAYGDDSIRVFGKGRSLTPLLKHRLQKQITQIQWMPYCASILAVGCQSGILLWTLDPISVVTRPSGSCLSSLAHPATLPLTSLSWHPKGLRLACVGGKGRELVVWDIASEAHCTVHSGIATCISMVSWSPDGNRLLAAMSTAVIKVFETRSWSLERWSLASPLQSCAWSSC